MIDVLLRILVWIADHTLIMMVIGAAIALLLKVEERIPKRFERWLYIADVAFIISSLLLGVLKDHLDSKWQSELETKVANVTTRASQAENELARIKKQQRDREITPEQSVAFVKMLKDAPKGKVIVYIFQHEGEVLRYADQIARMVSAAGFADVVIENDFGTSAEAFGVTLVVKETAHLLPHVVPLRKAFQLGAGIETDLKSKPEWPADVVKIVVARRKPL